MSRIPYDAEPADVGEKLWIDDYGKHNDWGRDNGDRRFPIQVEVLAITERDYDEDYPARYIMRDAAGHAFERSEGEAWVSETIALRALCDQALRSLDRAREDADQSTRALNRYHARLVDLEKKG